MKLKKLTIGSTELPGNLFLAPMADVTNLAFRLLCRQYGADLTYTEMINADALINENRKAIMKGLTDREDWPFGIQLVGNSPESLRKAALLVDEELRPAVIDVNMGCPAKCITRAGCGSALLKSPELVHKIISGLADTLETPVSAKIRVLGREEESLEIARLIEDAGAFALTVHGRTAEQMYSGCNGVMVGRPAMGNPFIFRRIRHYLETGEKLETDPRTRQFGDFEAYINLLEEHGLLSSINLRMHAQWFTKGLRGSRHIRERINGLEDAKSIIELMKSSCREKY